MNGFMVLCGNFYSFIYDTTHTEMTIGTVTSFISAKAYNIQISKVSQLLAAELQV